MIQPEQDSSASITTFWTLVDQRINSAIRDSLRTTGITRARGLTLNIPLADSASAPAVGWLQSVVIFHTCRITAWEIIALTSGSITIDIRKSVIPANPSTVPLLTSMPGGANFPSMNGYSTASYDTSAWTNRDIQAGDVLHFYVQSASGIRQSILGLQLMDMYGKVLQI